MELRITKDPYPRIKTAYFSILTIAYIFLQQRQTECQVLIYEKVNNVSDRRGTTYVPQCILHGKMSDN